MSTPTPAHAHDIIRAAQELEKTAKKLRAQAEQITISEGRSDAAKSRAKELRRAGREAARRAGYCKSDLHQHIHAVADLFKTYPETVLVHAKRACDTRAAHDRAVRNREIIRLAKAGHTNSEIATRCTPPISTRTVSRVIADQFRTV